MTYLKNMKSLSIEQELQEEQYKFPYHYIPTLVSGLKPR
jgi:hypothetical protein